MPIYKDQRLKDFKEKGTIETISYEQFQQLIRPIGDKPTRLLFMFLYFTGARPSELRTIIAKDVVKKGKTLWIKVPTSKHGRERNIPFSLAKFSELNELLEWNDHLLPDQYMFPIMALKQQIRHFISSRFKKHGLNIPLYFLRHNRFSLLAEHGATPEQIKYFKGAKSLRSVEPYMHLSTQMQKKIQRFI